MKNVVAFTAIAVILAVSGLGYTFTVSEANRRSAETLYAEIQAVKADLASLQGRLTTLNGSLTQLSALILDLQSKVASLETRVRTLEAEKTIVIRISFLSLVPDRTPPGGEDYLIDAEAEGPGGLYAQARTGHSRFIKPRYLDLTIRNGTRFIGTQVTVRIYAYWHLDDVVIDIDPDRAHGRTIGTDPSGGYLTLTYAVGTVLQGSVNGNDDGYLLDLYDAYLTYKIETPT